MRYHPMQMHLHTCHQPGASMEGHIYNAASLGMKYVRFTDHDTRTGANENPVHGFDFSRGELVISDGEKSEYGWRAVGAAELFPIDGAMRVSVSNHAGTAGAEFFSTGKRHTVSLIAGVSLTVGLRSDMPATARAVIDIRLSQRPPENKPAHIKYIIGSAPRGNAQNTVIKLLPVSENGIYELNLSEMCEEFPQIGGLDNVFDSISFFVEGGGELIIDRFDIKVEREFDEVICAQRVIADKIGEKYGVKPFVTTEISGAGQHKNCWSEHVPVINYRERGYSVSAEEAIAHVKAHGGIFSYNHPFESPKYKRRKFTEEQISEIVARESAELIENCVWGAATVELGFPEGRGEFSLQSHLALWDNLSAAGVFITGIGDSDSHHSDKGWLSGNNFVTWHGVPEDLDFPISLNNFNDALLAGRAYFGDPARIRGKIGFSAEGAEMGSVIVAENFRTVTASFNAEGLSVGARVRVIMNGRLFFEQSVRDEEPIGLIIPMSISAPVCFCRVEVYDTDGRCVLLTNPIYAVDEKAFEGDIPRERLKRVRREYRLPDGAQLLTGRRLLHISDTSTRDFSDVEMLIKEFKPHVILHTGDMVDEVKVGRIPEVREEYIAKLSVLSNLLRESGAELVVVSGNNDLPDKIEEFLPTARILKKNSVIEIDGEECRVGHSVMAMTFDRRWCFYGHGYTGDDWSPAENDPSRHVRLNGCETYHLCCLKDGKYYAIGHK